MPPKKKRIRRTTNIDEEQAQSIEEMSEFNRIGLSGTVRLLLDEAIAARKGDSMSFSLSSLREYMRIQSNDEVLAIAKLAIEMLQERSKEKS